MGPPTTPYRIPLSAPALLGRERAYLQQALDQNQLSGGAFVTRFEAAFAAYVGAPYAIACSSGTTALHLALLATAVAPGQRVQVPTLTYIASVNAVRYCRARPVFHDAHPATWNYHGAPTAKPFVSLVVHLYGVLAPIPRGVVIEDAAEALGARVASGAHAGTQGTAGIFSFYGNKVITCGEGGMIVTADADLAAHARHLRGQGQDPTRRYWHTAVGYNYRLTNLQAALGLAQLEQVEEHLDRRQRLWDRYADRLAGVLTWQTVPLGTTRSPWLFVGLVPHATDYPRVVAALNAAGIESRPAFPCVHTMPMYATGQTCPVAEDISARGICLPLHATLTAADVDQVCQVVQEALR